MAQEAIQSRPADETVAAHAASKPDVMPAVLATLQVSDRTEAAAEADQRVLVE
jgi:hypothetical protein